MIEVHEDSPAWLLSLSEAQRLVAAHHQGEGEQVGLVRALEMLDTAHVQVGAEIAQLSAIADDLADQLDQVEYIAETEAPKRLCLEHRREGDELFACTNPEGHSGPHRDETAPKAKDWS